MQLIFQERVPQSSPEKQAQAIAMSPDLFIVMDPFKNLMEDMNTSEKCTECAYTHFAYNFRGFTNPFEQEQQRAGRK